jgi:hypothetical protein
MTAPRRGHRITPQALPGADEASIRNRKVGMMIHCFFGVVPANRKDHNRAVPYKPAVGKAAQASRVAFPLRYSPLPVGLPAA